MAITNEARRAAILPLLALDLLEPTATEELHEHLSTGCHACKAELRAWSGIAALVAASVPPVRPSPELRTVVIGGALQSALVSGT